MTTQEMIGLLALVTSVDGRNLTDLSVDAWYAIIGHLPADAAHRAVTEHFRSSREWITPAHIAQAVHREQAAQPTQADLDDAGKCPWARLCTCTHTAPCDHGQIEGPPLAVGYNPSWKICPECDKARHACAAENGKRVTTQVPRPQRERAPVPASNHWNGAND